MLTCDLDSFLTSPTVLVVVGTSSQKTFFLHVGLLVSASDRFAIALQSDFKEATERKIVLDEEDPDLFGYFLKYLYGNDWLQSQETDHESKYYVLVRPYALGERLQAIRFQRTVLLKFMSSFTIDTQISDSGLCGLLEVAGAEITPRVDEDPLRKHLFWYAVRRLTQLQKYGRFRQLLRDQPDLGIALCLRAGNWLELQPGKPTDPAPARFKSETIF